MLLISERLIEEIYTRLAREPYSSVAEVILRLKHEVENQPVPDPPPPPMDDNPPPDTANFTKDQ